MAILLFFFFFNRTSTFKLINLAVRLDKFSSQQMNSYLAFLQYDYNSQNNIIDPLHLWLK